MNPLPRHLALDRALATEGPTPETLRVYVDWLLEREHPLASWAEDQERARAGQPEALRRVRERRFELSTPGGDLQLAVGWEGGLPVGIDIQAPELSTLWEPDLPGHVLAGALSSPWFGLLGSARLALSGQDAIDGPLVAALAHLPPSIGRLSLIDARLPASSGSWIDCRALALPWLVDLRLRVQALIALPPPEVRTSVRRLELWVAEPGALSGEPWTGLEELQVCSDLGQPLIEELVSSAPGLHTLGIHHDGPLSDLVDWPLPSGLCELVLAVRSAEPAAIADLDRRLPSGVRTVRLPWAALGRGPLPGRFVSAPTDDTPLLS